MESILLSIKTLIGGAFVDSSDFDTDLIININSALSILHQLGLGPEDGFKITSDSETWSDFLGTDVKTLEDAKIYVYLRTRLTFDPPANSFLVNAIEKDIKELEWRLNVAAEPLGSTEETGNG